MLTMNEFPIARRMLDNCKDMFPQYDEYMNKIQTAEKRYIENIHHNKYVKFGFRDLC